MSLLRLLPYIFIVFAFVIALHQYFFYDVWFEIDDLHHETWMIMFAFAGVFLLVRKKI